MRITDSTALVDTDFIIHISDINRECDKICELLRAVFLFLEVDAAVHPMVYEIEMPKTNTIINSFFDDNIIDKPSFDEIFEGCQEKKEYYSFIVPQLYRKFNGLPEETESAEHHSELNSENVFTFWKKGESLGEIHSIALCAVFDCAAFLSDDNDSKKVLKYAKEYIAGVLKVYNRKDIISVAKEQEFNLFGNRADKRAFAYTVADYENKDY